MPEPDITPQVDQADDEPDDERRERTSGIPFWTGPDEVSSSHGTVTGAICVLLISLNVALVPDLIWWPLPVVGMLLGLGVHWWFGYDRLEEQLRRQQLRSNDAPSAAGDCPGPAGTTGGARP